MFQYRIENKEFILFLTEPGSEIFFDNAEEMTALARKAVEDGYASVTFDFANLKFIDSSGIGRLIKISKMLPVSLKNVSDSILDLFKLTGVKSYFNYK